MQLPQDVWSEIIFHITDVHTLCSLRAVSRSLCVLVPHQTTELTEFCHIHTRALSVFPKARRLCGWLFLRTMDDVRLLVEHGPYCELNIDLHLMRTDRTETLIRALCRILTKCMRGGRFAFRLGNHQNHYLSYLAIDTDVIYFDYGALLRPPANFVDLCWAIQHNICPSAIGVNAFWDGKPWFGAFSCAIELHVVISPSDQSLVCISNAFRLMLTDVQFERLIILPLENIGTNIDILMGGIAGVEEEVFALSPRHLFLSPDMLRSHFSDKVIHRMLMHLGTVTYIKVDMSSNALSAELCPFFDKDVLSA